MPAKKKGTLIFSLKWRFAQIAELRWWKNYLKDKNPENYLQWKKNYWQTLITECEQVMGPIQEGKKVLDAGCGPAGIFMNLPKNEVVAIDPLLSGYKESIALFVPENFPYVRFITSSIEDFAERAEFFDLIFCMNVINHVRDFEKAVENLTRLCPAGGYLVYTIDAHRFPLLKHLFRMLPGDVLHPVQMDLEEYRKAFRGQHAEVVYEQRIKRDGLFDHYLLILKKQGARDGLKNFKDTAFEG